jgi:hypothetical protein
LSLPRCSSSTSASRRWRIAIWAMSGAVRSAGHAWTPDPKLKMRRFLRKSGRIEARTGLRMMPTSPRSPLSFRTAGFPQYGWKDGVSDGAFPMRRSVQACSRHTLTTYWFASVLRASRRIHECPAQCRVGYAPMHRRGGWVILLPRGPRSSPGCAVPVCHHLIDPIRPTRRHITTSPQGGLYAMPSLCGSA